MVENQDQGPFYQISDTKNPDLLRERQSAIFDVEQLSQFMFGRPNSYFSISRRRQISELKQKNSTLFFLFYFLFSSSSLFTSNT
jgi:hypothetical protein